MTARQTIRLGFEVGSGKPVDVPLRHTAVTGQTQESGKTTTLEAMVSRSGAPALAFVTKRGEGAFGGPTTNLIAPYFRDRADWQFVDQLIAAQLQEKNKFLRPWIMRICRTTRTLSDVHAAVREALKTTKRPVDVGVFTQLDAYLDLVVPELSANRHKFATGIRLEPGLNVMDVSGYATPMQMLFIQSALDWVNGQERGVVTIIPEAWEFVPEGKGSPAKASAVSLIRKGAGLRNYLWVDSQDMAGVDKTILRGCAVWIIGVQREANEIKRNLSNIPAGIRKPRAEDVALLKVGQFFACWSDKTVKTYVWPAWMTEQDAENFARGRVSAGAERFARSMADSITSPASNDHVARTGEMIEPARMRAHDATPPPSYRTHRTEARAVDEGVRLPKLNERPAKENDMSKTDNAAADLVDAIRRIVGQVPAVETIDVVRLTDAVTKNVLAAIPKNGGGGYTITPPAKLRADFMRQERDRLIEDTKSLRPLPRRIFKLLEAIEGQLIGQTKIAERLGRSTGGQSWMDLGKAVKELEALGFVEVIAKQGVKSILRSKIAADLETYQATDDDVEATYQNVIHAIATDGD